MRSFFITFVASFSFGSVHADEETHCLPTETTVFSCSMKKKIVSICTSPDLTATTGTIQYRFGTPGHKLELVYPPQPGSLGKNFKFASNSYPKGTTTELEFSIGNYTYTVYVETHVFHDNGAGVMVHHEERNIRNLQCAVGSERINSYRFWSLRDTGIEVHGPRGGGIYRD